MFDRKTDKEYGYLTELPKDRSLPEGHQIDITDISGLTISPDGHNIITDVKLIEHILNSYIDVSTIDNAASFSNYKLDFGIVFIDTMWQVMYSKFLDMASYCSELDRQVSDIQHRMTKPYLLGQTISREDKLILYEILEDVCIKRRQIKDTMVVIKTFLENIDKIKNSILSMNKRQYFPKSDRFQGDKTFEITNNEKINI